MDTPARYVAYDKVQKKEQRSRNQKKRGQIVIPASQIHRSAKEYDRSSAKQDVASRELYEWESFDA